MHNRGLLKYKVHHLLFWMLVFGLWYYLRYQDYANGQQAFRVTLLKVADLAFMIYLTNYILIPRLLYRKQYFSFVFIFLFMIVASSIGKMYIIGQITDNPQLFSFTGNLKQRFYENVITHFFLVIGGAAIQLIFDYTKMQQRLAEVAKEKAETELNFLKSQINPHFLFNSLNAVYFLIHKDNTEARQSLHKFSEMLRYQLYEAGDDKIPIEKEIHYLKDYMDLQQLRKDEKYSVQFHCSPAVKGFTIEPLLLIPFVENAFKHISHHNDTSNYVKVNLGRENGRFHFSVENSTEKHVPSHSGRIGIGLPNVKRRLELLYPGKHELNIQETDHSYAVHLNLHLS